MEWSDHGIVLSTRKHGEAAAIVALLTRAHGRHAGLVQGGAGRRARGLYQAGNVVSARWRGRLSEHLGSYSCELEQAHTGAFLDDPLRLAALSSACALSATAIPEREPHPVLFDALINFLHALAGIGWRGAYVRWEIQLLRELGFGLDLSSCAATGATQDLIYVSPNSGRAVGREAGARYADRLLKLPAFLRVDAAKEDEIPPSDIRDGLALTGFFLTHHVYEALDRPLPAARARYIDRLG